MAHIASAEEIWYNRIKPLGFEPLPLFEMQPLDVLQQRLEASAERWLELINTFSNLDEIVAYTTTEGRPYKSSINDLLLHVANHGTYHRGQIATLMRQSGQEPMATDYIVYIRGLENH